MRSIMRNAVLKASASLLYAAGTARASTSTVLGGERVVPVRRERPELASRTYMVQRDDGLVTC